MVKWCMSGFVYRVDICALGKKKLGDLHITHRRGYVKCRVVRATDPGIHVDAVIDEPLYPSQIAMGCRLP